ncbi:hypothetical protein [Psychrobacter sp. FDAARGOS_221]|uniref:hypothetical protein n=1 Tax=Psychrobacter sp. FDAARGOS_221 TaxID=1975705 RepID=UPI000BB54B90|nr:hypothetical protein [Psychrobacter sp. FDAARGOS_221]PNK60881.1 hypothetical protein A6J60_008300 [Psychrobacter sp. FDAARGOS_221]
MISNKKIADTLTATTVLRWLLGAVISLLCTITHANMASPETYGTHAETAFFSQDIDVVAEDIEIVIKDNFNTADYHIRYSVYSDKDRASIPLVFDVVDEVDDFSVMLDNTDVAVRSVKRVSELGSLSSRYDSQSRAYYNRGNDDIDQISFGAEAKYFVIELSPGPHEITVNYSARPNENRIDWTKRYEYTYSLAPAKLWKSFQDLTVRLSLDASIDPKYVSTNLNPDAVVSQQMQWHFDSLPQDTISIDYQQQPTGLAAFLIKIDPRLWLLLLLAIFGFIHCYLIYQHYEKSGATTVIAGQAKSRQTANIRRLVWGGILLVPLMALIPLVWLPDLIDGLIGEQASRYHGYPFLIPIFAYPPVLVLYLGVVLLFNWYLKHKSFKHKKRSGH